MLHLKAVAYFSLDQAIMGNIKLWMNQQTFIFSQPMKEWQRTIQHLSVCLSTGDDILSAYTSPLLVDLLDAAIRQVIITLGLNFHSFISPKEREQTINIFYKTIKKMEFYKEQYLYLHTFITCLTQKNVKIEMWFPNAKEKLFENNYI